MEEGNPANDGKDRVALVFDDGQLVLKVGVPVADARLGRAVLLGVLCLSYGDLFSDLALALTNLDTEFAGFSYASLSAIGLSLFAQAVTIKASTKCPWLSKDVLLGLVGLGPMLEAYRQIFGDENRDPTAKDAVQILSALKAEEVTVETISDVFFTRFEKR